MADNYLERQYEQYEMRKRAWELERKYGKRKKKTSQNLDIQDSSKDNTSEEEKP